MSHPIGVRSAVDFQLANCYSIFRKFLLLDSKLRLANATATDSASSDMSRRRFLLHSILSLHLLLPGFRITITYVSIWRQRKH